MKKKQNPNLVPLYISEHYIYIGMYIFDVSVQQQLNSSSLSYVIAGFECDLHIETTIYGTGPFGNDRLQLVLGILLQHK